MNPQLGWRLWRRNHKGRVLVGHMIMIQKLWRLPDRVVIHSRPQFPRSFDLKY